MVADAVLLAAFLKCYAKRNRGVRVTPEQLAGVIAGLTYAERSITHVHAEATDYGVRLLREIAGAVAGHCEAFAAAVAESVAAD